MTRSATKLLHPKWWLLHVFTVSVCITMVFLGRWQWRVAHQHHGDIRYYAYAFQWWAFTLFALMMWLRIVLDYLRADPGTPQPAESRAPAEPAAGYRAYVPPTTQEPEQDSERVRFNSYLRALNTEAKGHE